jgi:uncharacterized protein YqgC (DUF456 family)
MEIVLLIIGIVFLVLGLIGAVLPIPGPPLSLVGLFVLNYSKYFIFNSTALTIITIATIIISILDYYIPILGTKKFGGSKWGSIGATIGLLIGVFLGPIGIILGPFIGAFIGEILYTKDQNQAFKSALGSFFGFLTGVILKVSLCIYMIYFAFANTTYFN